MNTETTMKSESVKPLIEALQFYAAPLNYLGAPAPVYSDSGKKAYKALCDFASNGRNDWWNDGRGLDATDIDYLKKRIGERLWAGVIHLGGINTGTWLPWPGSEGNCVRDILRLYKSKKDFREYE